MRKDFLRIFLLILGFYSLLVFSQKIGSAFIPNRTSFESPVLLSNRMRSSLLPWLNSDGRNYLDIAISGYHERGTMDLSVFFPLFPLLIRLLSFNLLFNPVYIGLLLSSAFLILSVFYLYKFISRIHDSRLAVKVITMMLFFPTAYFFPAYYTESLFLTWTVIFFILLARKKYWLAALVCSLATATRVVGLALIPPLAWELYLRYRTDGRFPYPLLVSPLGLFFYLIYTQITRGNWALVFSGQAYWSRKFSLLNPFTSFAEWTGKVLAGPQPGYDSPFVYPGIIIEFLSVLFLFILVIKMYRRISAPLYLYVASSFAILLLAGNFSSVPRYILVMFPVFIFLARHITGKVLILYYLLSSGLLIYMTALFTRGYWAG